MNSFVNVTNAVILLTALTSCAAPGPAIDTACGWVRPIYITPADVLSPSTAVEILSHNETVDLNCPARK